MLISDKIAIDVVFDSFVVLFIFSFLHLSFEVIQKFLSDVGVWNFTGAYLLVVLGAIGTVHAANVFGLIQRSVHTTSSHVSTAAIEQCHNIYIRLFRKVVKEVFHAEEFTPHTYGCQ